MLSTSCPKDNPPDYSIPALEDYPSVRAWADAIESLSRNPAWRRFYWAMRGEPDRESYRPSPCPYQLALERARAERRKQKRKRVACLLRHLDALKRWAPQEWRLLIQGGK